MTREFFNIQFAALVAAYPISQKLSSQTQDVYWEMLNEIPEEDFADGVKECLVSCKYFPSIAELGDASLPSYEIRIGSIPPIDRPWPTKKITWRQQIEDFKQAKERSNIEIKSLPELPPPEPPLSQDEINQNIEFFRETIKKLDRKMRMA